MEGKESAGVSGVNTRGSGSAKVCSVTTPGLVWMNKAVDPADRIFENCREPITA